MISQLIQDRVGAINQGELKKKDTNMLGEWNKTVHHADKADRHTKKLREI